MRAELGSQDVYPLNASAHDILVAHAAYKRDLAKMPRRVLEMASDAGRPAFSDTASSLTDIRAEVAPRAGEAVLLKNDASAFCEGELEQLLRQSAAAESVCMCNGVKGR